MKKLKYLILSVIVLFSSSCGEEYLDVNTDPNNPSTAPLNYVLPAAQASTGGVVGGYYAILGGIWSQYYTQNNASNQYKDLDAFYMEPQDFQNEWQELYAGALNDYNDVKRQASAKGDWSYYLIATVMEAYTFQVLVDLYDRIPFTEALKADQNTIYAKFDEGSVVYDSLIVRIDNALAKDLNAETVTNPGTADLVFGGNLDKWIQFANTLKLKIYLRQSEARPSIAQAGVAALFASGASFLNSDAAIDIFADEASKSNPLFETDQRQLNTPQNLKASQTFFDFLREYNDPRLDSVYRPQLGKPQRAMQQGDFNAPSTQLDPLTISRARINATDAVYLISLPESYFLQAEAVERGWAPGGTAAAKALYDDGVLASFSMDAFSGESFIAPGGAYEYGVFYNGDKLGSIIMQKWAAMAGTDQGLEAFFERNRTNYPKEKPGSFYTGDWQPGDIVYPKEGVTGGLFGRRLLFPESEVNRNPNTPTQVNVTDKVWWDVN